MAKPTVQVERRAGAAWLTLPARGWTSVGVAALDALERACAPLYDDESVRAVIVTGESSAFCGDWSRTVDGRTEQADGQCGRAFACLADLPQPVIAAVNGPAHGAALELALAADIRIAADSADFLLCDGEAVPLAGGITRLGRAIGRAATAWMALTGALLSANEALRLGLVSAVLPLDQLQAEATRLAAVIGSRGPIAVRFAKEALLHGADLTLP